MVKWISFVPHVDKNANLNQKSLLKAALSRAGMEKASPSTSVSQFLVSREECSKDVFVQQGPRSNRAHAGGRRSK